MHHPKFHYSPPPAVKTATITTTTTTNLKTTTTAGRLIRERTRLPHLAEPGPYDVVCGKGKHVIEHSGNKWLKELARQHLKCYARSQDKAEKSAIISKIVDTVRSASKDGGFIKQDKKTGQWWEVGDHPAHEKVSFVLRDFLFGKYKSNSKERYLKRKAIKEATTKDGITTAVAAVTEQHRPAAAFEPAPPPRSEPPAAARPPNEDRCRRIEHHPRPNSARMDDSGAMPFMVNRTMNHGSTSIGPNNNNNNLVSRRHCEASFGTTSTRADPPYWPHPQMPPNNRRVVVETSPIRRLPPPDHSDVASPPPPSRPNCAVSVPNCPPLYPPPPPCYATKAAATATTPCLSTTSTAQDILASIYNGKLPLINLPALLLQQQQQLAMKTVQVHAMTGTNAAVALLAQQQPPKRADSPFQATNTTVTAEDETQASDTDEPKEESDTEQVAAAVRVRRRGQYHYDHDHDNVSTCSTTKWHRRFNSSSFDAALAQAMDEVLAPADNDALRDFSERRLINFADVIVGAAQRFRDNLDSKITGGANLP